MRPVATDVAHSIVCVSVCLSMHLSMYLLLCWSQVYGAKMAEPIEMLFLGQLLWAKEPCITNDGGRDPLMGRDNFGGCSANCEALAVSAAVYAAKWIIHCSITA